MVVEEKQVYAAHLSVWSLSKKKKTLPTNHLPLLRTKQLYFEEPVEQRLPQSSELPSSELEASTAGVFVLKCSVYKDHHR